MKANFLKISLAAFALSSATLLAVVASPATSTEITVRSEEPTRTEIKFEELPEAVSAAFKKSEYADWKVEKVFKVETENQVSYEIQVSGNGQMETLAYDAAGKVIE